MKKRLYIILKKTHFLNRYIQAYVEGPGDVLCPAQGQVRVHRVRYCHPLEGQVRVHRVRNCNWYANCTARAETIQA